MRQLGCAAQLRVVGQRRLVGQRDVADKPKLEDRPDFTGRLQLARQVGSRGRRNDMSRLSSPTCFRAAAFSTWRQQQQEQQF